MPDDARRAMKEKLLDDARAWETDHPDRSFVDILRNAIDLDPTYLDRLRGSLGLEEEDVLDWCAGRALPDTFARWAVIDDLKKFLEADLD
ncbi:MAG: hypothetical protein QY323_06110 [Patescibacteria group bacterium]|nr:MAG: hypothetical protein QY323_06110 [Patescibacteria group bacterium]